MQTKTTLLSLLGIAVAAVITSAPAHAQATRTWVSGVGDDVNPCSRTAPCKTFPGAISKTAAGGEINCLDPGGFGAVTITKAITIDCKGVAGGILASLVNGIIVSNTLPAGAVVSIKNLDIQGVGNGINGIRWLAGSGTLHVDNVRISGFTTRGIDFTPTGNAELFVTDTVIHETGGAVATNAAIVVRPTGSAAASANIANSRLKNSANGLLVDNTATTGVVNATVQGSSIVGNTTNGIASTSNASTVALVGVLNSVVQANGTGISSTGAQSIVRLHQSMITGNGTGLVTASSGQIISFTSNVRTGNLTTEGNPTSTVGQQ